MLLRKFKYKKKSTKFAFNENEREGYKLNKTPSGLLVCRLITSPVQKLSLSFQISP